MRPEDKLAGGRIDNSYSISCHKLNKLINMLKNTNHLFTFGLNWKNRVMLSYLTYSACSHCVPLCWTGLSSTFLVSCWFWSPAITFFHFYLHTLWICGTENLAWPNSTRAVIAGFRTIGPWTKLPPTGKDKKDRKASQNFFHDIKQLLDEVFVISGIIHWTIDYLGHHINHIL